MAGQRDKECVLLVGLEGEEEEALSERLAEQGYRIRSSRSLPVALASFAREDPSAVVMSSLLEGADAERFGRVLREANRDVLIVFACSHEVETKYFITHFPPPLHALTRPVQSEAVLALLRGDPRGTAHRRARSAPLSPGNLKETPFAELMVDMLDDARTGVLRIGKAPVNKAVYFSNGVPTYAESNILAENLGRFLMREGVITQADLERAREVQLRENIMQGAALVRIGVVSNAELFQLLRRQIEEKIINCFGLREAAFTFERDDQEVTDKLGFDLNPFALMVAGLMRFQDQDLVRGREENADRLAVITDDSQVPMWRFADEILPSDFCRWVSKPCRLSALKRRTGWSPEHLSAVVSAITVARMCRDEVILPDARPITGATVPAGVPSVRGFGPVVRTSALFARIDEIMELYLRFQSATYYEALELPRDANSDRIIRVRDRLLEAYSSANFGRALPTDVKRKLWEIVGKIRTAGDVLLDPDRRTAYDIALDRPADATHTETLIEAEVQHLLGVELLGDGDYAGAQACFERAADLNPDEPTYHLYHGWATYCALPSDADREAAKQEVEAAVDMNPLLDSGYAFLGQILADEGDVQGAIEQLDLALHFNPENRTARSLRDRLGRKR